MFNNKIKVIWVFSTPYKIPSDIVGCIMPADYLKMQKLYLSETHDIFDLLNTIRPDIIVIGKCFHSNVINLAVEASKRGIKIISCFNDWHFKPTNTKQEKKFMLNLQLAKQSNINIVKSVDAGNLLKQNTGLNYEVIPDCIRFKSLNVNTNLSNKPSLLWFGSSSNHDTLFKGLFEIENKKIYTTVNIVTNLSPDFSDKLVKCNFKYIKPILTPFSDENLVKIAITSSIIIIPFIDDHIRLVKSSNRIIDALNFGRFVIKSNTTFNLQFDDFCYVGDIGDGLEWYSKNPKIVKSKIAAGKQYVTNHYSIHKIASEWSQLLNKL